MQDSNESSTPSAEVTTFEQVSALFRKAVDDGVFPGAVVLAGKNGDVVYRESFGLRTVKSSKVPEPMPMAQDTVFDVAELTTVVVTATLLMKLIEEGKVNLDDRVSRYIQGFGVLGKSAVTVRQLVSHSSGLLHWMPFFEELLNEQSGARRGIMTSRGARDYIINSINRMELKTEPGSKQVYSDVGYILLGHLLEILTGLSLDRAAQRYLFQPLGLKSTSYIDLSMIKRRGIHPVTDLIAPTEECSWRKRVLCGEVHDDNAWAMGGVAGHGGLFSNANDLHVFASTLLAAYKGQGQYLKSATVKTFFDGSADFPEGRRFGWDVPSRENGMIEAGLSRKAVGINGFTGCSLWLEPEEGLDVIVLSNRICPTRNNRKILSFRPEAYSMILKALRRV